MSKFVKKLRPNDYWRIGEHESWFSDMSKKGLHLKSVGAYFAKFEKGEPKNMNYRIDISYNENYLSKAELELCEECGWTYVDGYKNYGGSVLNPHDKFHVFSSPEELNAPELHTDPEEQSYTLKDLKQEFTTNSILLTILVSLYIALLFLLFFTEKTHYLTLVDIQFHMYLMLTLVYLYRVFILIKGTITIRRLIKSLSQGNPINHKAPWNGISRKSQVISMIMFVGILLYMFSQIYTTRIHVITNDTCNLPVVTLCDIEDTKDMVRTGYITVNESNNYIYSWNIFATKYDSFESSTKNGTDIDLSTTLYKLTFPSMADNLLSDLVKKHSLGNDLIKIENNNFDSIFTSKYNNHNKILASRGGYIMYVYYYGNSDIDNILEVISEKFDMLAK